MGETWSEKLVVEEEFGFKLIDSREALKTAKQRNNMLLKNYLWFSSMALLLERNK